MINKKYENLGKNSSVIRELFEYGKMRKSIVGEDKVYDFSLGNPSVPAPIETTNVLKNLIENTDPVKLHGYTSAPGDINVRRKIAEYLTEKSGVEVSENLIYMTCGAAASLTISLSAITNCGDEVIVFAPFFPEYKVFIENCNCTPVVCKCDAPDFSINFNKLEQLISEKTSALIINSPNNPTGAVISEEEIIKLGELLRLKQERFGHPIYLISDEPYRELVYGDTFVAFPAVYFNNTITCYSFSKSLSLPGERIGYIQVSKTADCAADVYAAICGAGRSLGFVCAPSMLQYAVAECLGKTSDINAYECNRNILLTKLSEIGYTVVQPQGAFYLFVKALEDNAYSFSQKAKEFDLLLVPSESFGVDGYVRISYCVSKKTVEDSISAFKALYDEYAEK